MQQPGHQNSSSGDCRAENERLLEAARNSRIDDLRRALVSGANPNHAVNGVSALYICTSQAFVEGVELLLASGADPELTTPEGFTCLHMAACFGSLPIVKLLVSHKATVDPRSGVNVTPLCYAAESRHLDIVEFLLAQGANPDVRTVDGVSPLFFAAKSGDTRIMTMLLEQRVAVDAEVQGGETAMFESVKADSLDGLLLLKQWGANPVRSVSYGATLMHLVCFKGSIKFLPYLLSWGLSPNAQTTEGCTALHYAAYMGNLMGVKFLLAIGCDPRIMSVYSEWSQQHHNYGKTALDYSRERYLCTDIRCSCHTQRPVEANKKHCEQEILTAMSSVPSLQQLCRTAFWKHMTRTSEASTNDPTDGLKQPLFYNFAVLDELPVVDIVKSYLRFDREIRDFNRSLAAAALTDAQDEAHNDAQ